MANQFAKIAFTDAVKQVQALMGSRQTYARGEAGPVTIHELTADEAHFIGERDSFYMASISATNWPYVQHRGGPKGFVRVLSATEIGFADFSGNRQYISVGNFKENNKVAIIMVDYPNQARLKLLGEVKLIDQASDPDTLAKLAPTDYDAKIERGFVIRIEAYDWNCSQHIVPRWTADEIQKAVLPLQKRIEELELEISQLKRR